MSTSSTSPTTKRRPTTHVHEREDRQQRWVRIGFVALIAAVIVALLLGLLYGYWDQHWRPIASVAGSGISRDDWTARAKLEDFRLSREESRIRAALTAGQIPEAEASRRLQSVGAARQSVESGSLENLIDLTYQSKLAQDQGVSVTDQQVDTAVANAGTSPERRKVEAVVIQPVPGGGGAGTPADRQAAYRAAKAAEAALAAGTPFDEVVATYSTDATKDSGGDQGYLTADDTTVDPAWRAAIFALAQDGVTPLLHGQDGAYRIGRVTEIVPGEPDPAYQADLERAVGADTERRNVRLETIAGALKTKVTTDATTGDVPQVHLAEILVEGDAFVDPAQDQGTIRASHILYSPLNDPQGARDLPADDPAWEEARVAAQAAANTLNAITDPAARQEAFAIRARVESDDTSAARNGGDLGYFGRADMIPEFADPLFDGTDLQPGDIVGPVRSAYGWHVIRFEDRRAPIADRLKAVTDALAKPGSDFSTVAATLSDGAEAVEGGDLGWRTVSSLDDVTAVAVAALAPGEVTEPLQLPDGYHVVKLIESADRPLDEAQRAAVTATAFDDWYAERRSQAETDGTITRDASTFQVGG